MFIQKNNFEDTMDTSNFKKINCCFQVNSMLLAKILQVH